MTKKMKRIAHITTVHTRRDTRIFLKQCRTLAAQPDYDVYLVVADGKGDAELDGVRIVDCGIAPGGKFGRVTKGVWRVFRAARRIRPSVVHFHDPELIPACLILRVLGHRVIYDVHEDFPRQLRGMHWLHPLVRGPISWAMSVAEWVAGAIFDQIVSATPNIAKRFPVSRTETIQNFPIASELNIPDGRPFQNRSASFAYVGNMTPIRGVKEMVMAIGHLDSAIGAKLKLAGTFKPPDFKESVSTLEGWTQTDFLGWSNRSEVARLLSDSLAGLVVFLPVPNHLEAYPNKMFEYMSAGLPVIASDFPLWRSIIEGADCGLLVDPQDPASIAKAMQWILENREEAAAMGQRGRKAIEETYNWDREAEKLLTIYRRMLAPDNHVRKVS